MLTQSCWLTHSCSSSVSNLPQNGGLHLQNYHSSNHKGFRLSPLPSVHRQIARHTCSSRSQRQLADILSRTFQGITCRHFYESLSRTPSGTARKDHTWQQQTFPGAAPRQPAKLTVNLSSSPSPRSLLKAPPAALCQGDPPPSTEPLRLLLVECPEGDEQCDDSAPCFPLDLFPPEIDPRGPDSEERRNPSCPPRRFRWEECPPGFEPPGPDPLAGTPPDCLYQAYLYELALTAEPGSISRDMLPPDISPCNDYVDGRGLFLRLLDRFKVPGPPTPIIPPVPKKNSRLLLVESPEGDEDYDQGLCFSLDLFPPEIDPRGPDSDERCDPRSAPRMFFWAECPPDLELPVPEPAPGTPTGPLSRAYLYDRTSADELGAISEELFPPGIFPGGLLHGANSPDGSKIHLRQSPDIKSFKVPPPPPPIRGWRKR